jgi:hypothetical protein
VITALVLAGVGLAVLACVAYVAVTWSRFGRARPSRTDEERDALLDTFMPAYEIVERHHIRVEAPAEITFETASEMDLERGAIVRTIFRAREWIMGSRPGREELPRQFLAQMRAIGWGVLAEIPGREVVMGAATQPWLADVVFRPLPPGEFAAFREPGYVKIVWTMRADPIDAAKSVFRTETRAVATDAAARARFRLYWSLASPGIILIRWLLLGPVKADAERRTRDARRPS